MRTALTIHACLISLLALSPGVAAPATIVGYERVLVFGTQGSGLGQFDYPYDVDVHGGELFVGDSNNDRVQVFDLEGHYLWSFGSSGSGDGEFSRNRGLCASELGIYVTDAKNDRIQAFDLMGVHRWSQGSIGDAPDQWFRPRGIDVTPTGQLVVTDADNHRVKILYPDGSTQVIIGRRGTAVGNFVAPFDVAISDEGKVYVIDIFNSRVQVFTLSGEFLFTWGVSGTGDGEFVEPRGIACGPGGLVAVSDVGKTDQVRDRIQVFDADGTFLCGFGSNGWGDGQFRFVTGLAFDPDGRIYAAEAHNHRVSVWAPISVDTETRSVGGLKSRFSGK